MSVFERAVETCGGNGAWSAPRLFPSSHAIAIGWVLATFYYQERLATQEAHIQELKDEGGRADTLKDDARDLAAEGQSLRNDGYVRRSRHEQGEQHSPTFDVPTQTRPSEQSAVD